MISGRDELDSNCSCEVGQLYVKDTICGISSFVNLVYMLICLLCVTSLVLLTLYFMYFRMRNLSYFKRRLAWAFAFAFYGHTALLVKSFDIIFDFPLPLYHFLENAQSVVIIAVGIYLTIWTRMYSELLEDTKSCSFRVMRLIESLVYILGVGQFSLGIIFALVPLGRGHGFGTYNELQVFSFIFRVFLFICFIGVGSLLLSTLRYLQISVY